MRCACGYKTYLSPDCMCPNCGKVNNPSTKTIWQRKEAARKELAIFNALPRALRGALNNCAAQPPRASIVRDALLRGVSEETIIETIERSQGSGQKMD